MPLEVNEIGIRMRVLGEGESPVSPGRGGPENVDSEEARERLVDACVRRVLQILKASQER